MWLVVVTLFLISGIACWASNLHADHADDWTDNAGVIVKSSIGNQGNPIFSDRDIPTWYVVLHLVNMVIMIVAFRIWK